MFACLSARAPVRCAPCQAAYFAKTANCDMGEPITPPARIVFALGFTLSRIGYVPRNFGNHFSGLTASITGKSGERG